MRTPEVYTATIIRNWFADAKEHNLENLKLALKHCEVKDSFFESIGISKDELLEVNK